MNKKFQQDHDVMGNDKRIPENDHAEYEDSGPGDHPVCNSCYTCNKSDNAPFEKDIQQWSRDDKILVQRYIDPIEIVLLLWVSMTIQVTSVSSIRASFPNRIPSWSRREFAGVSPSI